MKRLFLVCAAVASLVAIPSQGVRARNVPSMSAPVCAASAVIPVNPMSSYIRCALGSRGPGGGIVFYDAGELKWWGRYLEAAIVPGSSGVPWSTQPDKSIYEGDAATVQRLRIDAKAIGMGAINTKLIVAQSGFGRYAAGLAEDYSKNGYSDWFLPSKDELNAFYDFKATSNNFAVTAKFAEGSYWSSTEAWKNIAWYQIFRDGTQFSDSYLLAGKGGNKKLKANVKYPGTSYPGQPYAVVAIRAFPQVYGARPETSFPHLTGNTCTNDGPCAVGDIGPAGGVVFYAAPTRQAWGQYLEVSPKTAEKIGWPWRKPGYDPEVDRIYNESGEPSRVKRVRSKAIGMGAANTAAIVKEYGAGKYAAKWAADYEVNGYDDWFLPSADELDVMYNVLYAVEEPLIGFAPTYYWSSSEYDLKNAWTVLFRSGQRFDREGWFTTKETGKPNAIRVRPIRAFG